VLNAGLKHHKARNAAAMRSVGDPSASSRLLEVSRNSCKLIEAALLAYHQVAYDYDGDWRQHRNRGRGVQCARRLECRRQISAGERGGDGGDFEPEPLHALEAREHARARAVFDYERVDDNVGRRDPEGGERKRGNDGADFSEPGQPQEAQRGHTVDQNQPGFAAVAE
jgi:hypothetical protein